jgi:hypothetical protein
MPWGTRKASQQQLSYPGRKQRVGSDRDPFTLSQDLILWVVAQAVREILPDGDKEE